MINTCYTSVMTAHVMYLIVDTLINNTQNEKIIGWFMGTYSDWSK